MNSTISNIKSEILHSAGTADKFLSQELTCRFVSQDLSSLKNSLCTVTIMGLDGSWFALFIQGIVCLASIPIFIIAANRLAYYDEAPRKSSEKKSKDANVN
jgi:hypothetical protein